MKNYRVEFTFSGSFGEDFASDLIEDMLAENCIDAPNLSVYEVML